ncbi:hypothetical protein LG943_06050 [Streptomonospora sp. S1-112]|uniref:PRD domain-containing protein n=1 Tax=Streptomonospora mangrovi TaxID=2883123 RepID=A0A9X3NIW2_9ACTN|nr:hypothetical protein [Streptomonospora mangrovi]MDA0563890.1 hypothetical protein [Streptomonospora mangrovi]
MDPALLQRLDLVRGLPGTPPGVVDFVAAELARLEAGHRVTEETAGTLTAHLVAALTRALGGEPDVDPPSEAVYREVVEAVPGAPAAAAALAGRAETALGVRLSAAEQRYLSLHLGTLALTSPKEKP